MYGVWWVYYLRGVTVSHVKFMGCNVGVTWCSVGLCDVRWCNVGLCDVRWCNMGICCVRLYSVGLCGVRWCN